MATGRRTTIADIAARAGVSISAVSFALNGRPGVSEATRERVRQAARELDWQPHTAARALGGAKAGSIGFVLNRPARTLGTESFFGDLISGIQLGLTGTHIGMTLLVARDADEELETYRDWWRGHRVDGVIVIDPRRDDDRLRLLAQLGMPSVVVGSHPTPAGSAPSVWIDDSDATDTVLRYLRALGHRRIAHVSGPPEFEHTALRIERVRAFAGTLPDATEDDRTESIPTDYSAEAGSAATRRLLSGARRPTAIVFDNDVLAVAGLGVASEMGVRVPQDVSIVSFDDSAMIRLVRPAITSLTRDTVELGQRAAVLLREQIEADAPLPSRPGPELTLSVRESTARVAD
ncbi:LacI family transcriptional regulator [Curtobacterium sp. MCJR17_055]|uniref:LacI family DNA-binding transcriptional regulator n=1 Tax=unclassified Curtobacterium TaxID=257496 RepID=UPI000D80D780|nr:MULTISPECIES: LacI family DNA-binding transcriptional regulator [unclassified Curtobacterium]PYY34542.1 LacI family transcriptional regulator [Curtobacterium sp. MCBD17_029]PYY40122.1 LacI family transcriptional regulator [Curtobacterium sp. MCPF17_046]PYY49454.1 LacI family transcriptional regulator [Curtobacterium sp. MCBD17_023]PYY57642.1 LacI family transcriptional regulator [Curtobacterium sp. MCPF17_015]PYY58300.1 LacI family transcriptional regulator [Curtobacterium sp. MCJR17_055]